ncbi:MAG: TOBE domain-containing protein [Candidatus Atabeyarchaeum deiterrae]
MPNKPDGAETDSRGRAVKFRIWFSESGRDLLGKGGAEILERIAETCSILKTAKSLRRSYRQVWGQINEMEESYGRPLINRFKGGAKGGGGAELTEAGLVLLREYRRITEYTKSLLEDKYFWEAIGLKLSARNRLKGEIVSIEKDAVVAKIKVKITTPVTITSVITSEAADDLNLHEGDEVEAIVKSTEVLIAKE